MTDAQMITLMVAILALFAGTLFNNSRITDLRDSMNRRFDDFRNDINRHIDDKFALLDAKLDRILEIVGDHETRLQRLEQQRRSG
jgi:hypothetical protein